MRRRITPPQIIKPDTSIRDPYIKLVENTRNEVSEIVVPTDLGDLVFRYTGKLDWQPGGLALGQLQTLNIPSDVIREATVSIAQMVNSFNGSCARANEASN